MGAAVADVNSILIERCMHFVADVHRRSTIPVRLQFGHVRAYAPTDISTWLEVTIS